MYEPAATPVRSSVVAALLHAKVYGDVPPDPLAVADPFDKPLQVTFTFATVDAANTAGSVMVTLEVVVQELASDTVTVYVPAVTPVILAVVAELLHAKVYGEVPPVALAIAGLLFYLLNRDEKNKFDRIRKNVASRSVSKPITRHGQGGIAKGSTLFGKRSVPQKKV